MILRGPEALSNRLQPKKNTSEKGKNGKNMFWDFELQEFCHFKSFNHQFPNHNVECIQATMQADDQEVKSRR